jgi:nickel/cobalt exporter
MPTFTDLLQQGAAHAWLFIPSAILLGALHGLEPGHSKTMMAAFIIAVRGTVRQAVLLGLCATLSHTLIVWVIALGGLYLWRDLAPATLEPYLQLASGVMIILMGAWMLWRTRREQKFAAAGHDHHHGHDHAHGHDHHHDEVRLIDTGHGVLRLEIFETDAPPQVAGLAFAGEYQDPHELAHANDIRRRFSGREATTAQIAIFGLTGGLIPCPGAITVLLLCLQLRAFALGAALVLAFSLGLAMTMVASGVLAALSVKHVSKRFHGFGELVRRAPFVSGGVILVIGLYLGVNGWLHLPQA